MVSISMIDIVTVVFRDELPVLKLQAESIDLYCHKINLGNIYVIINDESLDVTKIDTQWWGSFSDRVKVLPRSVWGVSYVANGWLTQQLLKMLGSANSQNTWTMVLDAKTILVQEIDPGRIFDAHDRLTWGYYPVFPVFDRARQIVSNLFEINQQDVAGPAGVPFFFHNGTVRSMIRDIELRVRQPFDKWFQDAGMVTEFILYSGYVEYRDGSLDVMYSKSENPYYVCNICHNEVDQFEQKFFDMMDPNNLTVSIHRKAWAELTGIQRNVYKSFLIAHGISTAKDLQ